MVVHESVELLIMQCSKKQPARANDFVFRRVCITTPWHASQKQFQTYVWTGHADDSRPLAAQFVYQGCLQIQTEEEGSPPWFLILWSTLVGNQNNFVACLSLSDMHLLHLGLIFIMQPIPIHLLMFWNQIRKYRLPRWFCRHTRLTIITTTRRTAVLIWLNV